MSTKEINMSTKEINMSTKNISKQARWRKKMLFNIFETLDLITMSSDKINRIVFLAYLRRLCADKILSSTELKDWVADYFKKSDNQFRKKMISIMHGNHFGSHVIGSRLGKAVGSKDRIKAVSYIAADKADIDVTSVAKEMLTLHKSM